MLWRTRRAKHQRALEPGTDSCRADGDGSVRVPHSTAVHYRRRRRHHLSWIVLGPYWWEHKLFHKIYGVSYTSCLCPTELRITCSSQCVEEIRRFNDVDILFICPNGQHHFLSNENNILNTTQSSIFYDMFRPFVSAIIRYSHNNTFWKLYLDAAHTSV